jgi:hypothetical protein
MLILGARHLDKVLSEYLDHYNSHRPHWSLNQLPPGEAPIPSSQHADRQPIRRDVLGGLIHEYRWAA